MDSWYLPITIVPGLGLLILSTTNLMVSLRNEITSMLDKYYNINILTRKLVQLKRINTAMVLFYLSVSFLMISALINGVPNVESMASYVGILGAALTLLGMIILINCSFRAVVMKQ